MPDASMCRHRGMGWKCRGALKLNQLPGRHSWKSSSGTRREGITKIGRASWEGELPSGADQPNKTKRDWGPLDLATRRSQGRMSPMVKAKLQ